MSKSSENQHVRHWKHAFDPHIDVEQTTENPRIDLSKRQKDWLKRAWIWVFGFIPNAVPTYSERGGIRHQEGQSTHWHHITPVGVANRRDEEIYNYPKNLVPVDASNHVGREATPDQLIIHEDTKDALKEYGKFKRGEIEEHPFAKMSRDRREATLHGRDYHDLRLDNHFRKLADEVVTKYIHANPDDRWPD